MQSTNEFSVEGNGSNVKNHSKKRVLEQKMPEEKIDEMQAKSNRKSKVKNNPSILFVGQLPYDATSEDISGYFKNEGVEGEISVRLLTDPKTHAGKGMAFLTLDSPKAIFQGLALHHTKLKGRIINVERSCGGRNKQNRKQKLQDTRIKQNSIVATTVNRIIKEYIDKGSVMSSDFDEKMKISLRRLGGKLCVQVLEYFSTHLPPNLHSSSRRALLWNQIEALWHNNSLNSTLPSANDGLSNISAFNDDDDDGATSKRKIDDDETETVPRVDGDKKRKRKDEDRRPKASLK